MRRLLRGILPFATAVLVAIAVTAIVPWLGRPMPIVSAQLRCSQFGGQFGQLGGQLGQIGGQLGGQIGQFGQLGQFSGCNFGGSFGLPGFGNFLLLAPDSTVEVGQRFPLLFAWDVPSPGTWHDLRSLEVRLQDESGAAIWVRWDEAANTFSLIDPTTGTVQATGKPGSAERLETTLATLYLKDSTVEGSGETGTSVAVLLTISFKPPAVDRTFRVEERATSDPGEVQGFEFVGNIKVVEAKRDQDDKDEKLTEEQKQQKERTNKLGSGDYRTEGNVAGVRCDLAGEIPSVARGEVSFNRDDVPYALIATRDGVQQVRLLRETKSLCASIQVGDYLEIDGTKEHEFLFDAENVTIIRGGKRMH